MKSVCKYSKWIIAGIATMTVGLPIARGQSASLEASASANTTILAKKTPLTLSDEQNWQSFLKLAAKPNAEVTPDDLERAFGGGVISSNSPGIYEISHVLRYSVSVPPRLHELYPGRNQIYITLYFRGGDSDACQSKEKMVGDLQKAGWTVYRNLPERTEAGVDGIQLHLPSEADLLKGDQGILKLTYTNGCPSSAFMEADKIEFNEVARHFAKESGQ